VTVNKPLNSVLVKPAGPDCNLGCEYCFYLDKSRLFPDKGHRMSEPVLKALVRQVMRAGSRQVSFGWQGGEPTLMGVDFYRRAIEYQRRFGAAGQIVGNGLQTNGILIDAEWAQFLREAKFLVGLSLDGPQHVHDRYRKYKSGAPCWEQVARARDVLLQAGVAVNALVVVNDHSAQFAREIYEYHQQNGLEYMQFIPCLERDAGNPAGIAPYSVTAAAFGRFLCEVFDLWSADFRSGRPTTFIRWFDSVFYSYVGLAAPECTLLPECGIYTVVEHNGDVYACDFFVEPEWKLGNIMNDQLTDLLNSPLQNKFGAQKAVLPPECGECPWLTHCCCGCPRDRQSNPATRGSNHYCAAYKLFFEHADARLRQLAEQWRAQQGGANPRPAKPTTTDSTLKSAATAGANTTKAAATSVKAPALKSVATTGANTLKPTATTGATTPKPPAPPVASCANVGRNQACPCGSGVKYKYCCGRG